MSKQLKPLQLISITQDKSSKLLNTDFVVCSDAINWFNSISQQYHIGVIVIVGGYRSGRSYLLNRLFLNQNTGFEVGGTINPKTKGFWFWPQLIENPYDITTKYIIIDTEGLSADEQDQLIDSKIFLMSMLLSSVLIYNGVSTIDSNQIKQLVLINEISRLLQTGNDKDRQILVEGLPCLFWVIRDFCLRLQDRKGCVISRREYMEYSLKIQPGISKNVAFCNSIRETITRLFTDRECFTLIRPVITKKGLEYMSKLREDWIRPQFFRGIQELKNIIFTKAKMKVVNGRKCSPIMVILLCQYFCRGINQWRLPEIDNDWQTICRGEAIAMGKRCHNQFDALLKKIPNENIKDMDIKQIQVRLQSYIVSILKKINKSSDLDEVAIAKELRKKMGQKIGELKKERTEYMDRQIYRGDFDGNLGGIDEKNSCNDDISCGNGMGEGDDSSDTNKENQQKNALVEKVDGYHNTSSNKIENQNCTDSINNKQQCYRKKYLRQRIGELLTLTQKQFGKYQQ